MPDKVFVCDYCVIHLDQVTPYLNNGYQLHGPIIAIQDKNHHPIFMQGVIKKRSMRADQPINPLTLSRLESKILALIVKGDTAKQIARIVHRSKRTVEKTTQALCRKFQCKSKIQLAIRAYQLGLF